VSDLFTISPNENAAADALARANPYVDDSLEPGWFDRAPAAIGMGTMRGGALASKALSTLAVGAPLALYEQATDQPGKYLDPYFAQLDADSQSAVDFWTPDPHTTGAASKILGDLAGIVGPLALTGGNPSLLMAEMQTNTATDLVSAGVDPDTATKAGLLQSAATAVGFRLPIVGRGLPGRLAAGAAGNTATNAAASSATQTLLDKGGYGELGKQYDPMNLQARAVDVLTGMAFGGIHHLGARGAQAQEAALTALNAKHFQADTAPGKPADLPADLAHQQAMEIAFEQTLRGEPVDVGASRVQDQTFLPRDPTPITYEGKPVAPDSIEYQTLRTMLDHGKDAAIKDAQGALDYAERNLSDERMAYIGKDQLQAEVDGARAQLERVKALDPEKISQLRRGEPSITYQGKTYEPGTDEFYRLRDVAEDGKDALIANLQRNADYYRSKMDDPVFSMYRDKYAKSLEETEAKIAKIQEIDSADISQGTHDIRVPEGVTAEVISRPIGHGGKTLFYGRINGHDLPKEFVSYDAARAEVERVIHNTPVLSAETAAWAEGTKALDELGRPRLLHRGSPNPAGSTLSAKTDGLIYLAEDRGYADHYAGANGSVRTYVLKAENPLVIEGIEQDASKWTQDLTALGIPNAAELVAQAGVQEGGRGVDFDTLLNKNAAWSAAFRIGDGNLSPIAQAIKDAGHDSVRYRERLDDDIYGPGSDPEWSWVVFNKDSLRRADRAPEQRVEPPPTEGQVIGESLKEQGLEQEAAILKGEPPVATYTPDQIDRAKPGELSDSDRVIETEFAEWMAANYQEAKRLYAAMKDTRGGKILNTDTARELSPAYLKDRTRSQAVHEPASWFIKQLYAEALTTELKPGERRLVVVLAGGTGAGKTTMVHRLMPEIYEVPHVIYDTNNNSLPSANRRVDQALKKDFEVQLVYVYREPVEALTGGALPRAMGQEAKHGTGRTAPVTVHVDTHLGAREVTAQQAAYYAGDKRFAPVIVIDNSRGHGNQKVVPLREIPSFPPEVHNEIHAKAAAALEAEFANGAISESVYRGFKVAASNHAVGTAPAVAGEGISAGAAKPEAKKVGQPPPQIATVYTSAGRAVQVRPYVVELDSLITSDNKEYPAGLQPRDRASRVSSDNQISDIATKLRPAELGESATADTGAPIIGPDNAVESGNGRISALRQVYANLPEKAAEYRAWLESQGHNLTGLKKPVLIRWRVSAMSAADRQQFAIEANKPGVAEMSPVELAKADAKALDAEVMSLLEGGDVTLERNAAFVRAFVERLTEAERGGMMQADGTLSQKGERRLEGALLAKAYGDNPEAATILAQILESTENDVKTVTGAMMDAAPDIAKMRESINSGKTDKSFDITTDIVRAVQDLIKIKRTGRSLVESLGQVDALNPREPKIAEILNSFFNDKQTRLASRDTIARTLKKYADEAQRLNLQQGDIFGDKLPAPEAMLKAVRGTNPEPTALPQEDLFAVQPARDVAPDMVSPVVTGQVNADGSLQVETAEQIMARGDAAIEKAQQDAKGIEAAVTCFLSKGIAA
jgi:hypothetical protein